MKKIFIFISNFFAILKVVFKRLSHNLGVSISTLVGVVTVLSIVVCIPIFAHAVSREMLIQELKQKAASTNRRLFSFRVYYLFSNPTTVLDLDKSKQVSEYIKSRIPELMNVQVERVVMDLHSDSVDMKPLPSDIRYGNSIEPLRSIRLLLLDTLPQYSDIVEGTWPAPTSDEAANSNTPVNIAISEDLADELSLKVGEKYRLNNVEAEIAGIWRVRNHEDPIWFDDPTFYKDKIWLPEEIFRARAEQLSDHPISFVSWYVIINENDLNFQNSSQYAQGILRLGADLSRLLPGSKIDYSPLDALTGYKIREGSLTTLYLAVGAPMIVLALLFIGLTSKIAVQQYLQEMVVMRGRGTSWFQLMMMNLLESLFLILISLPLSILGGWLAAKIVGNTTSFLQFTSREQFAITLEGINIIWLSLAVFLILGARALPMLGLFHSSIVKMKQEQSRSGKRPFWERFFLDFALLIPAIYAYMVMRGWATPDKLLEQLKISGDQYRDPLLFFAPGLFSIAVCMILLRFIPLIIRLFAIMVTRFPGVTAYLSLQQIARRAQDHTSALLLIMISLSQAIYSASTAQTLDKWLFDSVYYRNGADLAVKEYILSTDSPENSVNLGSDSASGITATDVDVYGSGFSSVEMHLKIPSIQNSTRVGKYNGAFSYGVGETPCIIMGIDRVEFPQVAFYREDFSKESLGKLMNELGLEQMGVLLSTDAATKAGLGIGDQLSVTINLPNIVYARQMILVGIYDYFPTIYPGGKPVIIANLDSIFDNPDAVVGYNFWLDLKDGTDIKLLSEQIIQMIGDNRAVVDIKGNSLNDIKTGQVQPERLGIFGILNVGFLMTGLMPAIGFMLYSYASLRRRFIQLGILQAIGLSVAQLIGSIILEQVLLMGLAILAGASIGLLASSLYIPFLQAGSTSGVPVPPFHVLIGWVEAGWLSLGFSLILLLTTLSTIFYLARIKIFQAVKMGETL